MALGTDQCMGLACYTWACISLAFIRDITSLLSSCWGRSSSREVGESQESMSYREERKGFCTWEQAAWSSTVRTKIWEPLEQSTRAYSTIHPSLASTPTRELYSLTKLEGQYFCKDKTAWLCHTELTEHNREGFSSALLWAKISRCWFGYV